MFREGTKEPPRNHHLDTPPRSHPSTTAARAAARAAAATSHLCDFGVDFHFDASVRGVPQIAGGQDGEAAAFHDGDITQPAQDLAHALVVVADHGMADAVAVHDVGAPQLGVRRVHGFPHQFVQGLVPGQPGGGDVGSGGGVGN